MAKSVKVVVDDKGVEDFLRMNKAVRDMLYDLGRDVAAEASSTASDAEGGPGGRIDGYASAGFSVEWLGRKRPQVRVVSNAPGETALAAHFNSQRKKGVGHLRAALYKFATGAWKVWPSGQPYKYRRGSR